MKRTILKQLEPSTTEENDMKNIEDLEDFELSDLIFDLSIDENIRLGCVNLFY